MIDLSVILIGLIIVISIFVFTCSVKSNIHMFIASVVAIMVFLGVNYLIFNQEYFNNFADAVASYYSAYSFDNSLNYIKCLILMSTFILMFFISNLIIYKIDYYSKDILKVKNSALTFKFFISLIEIVLFTFTISVFLVSANPLLELHEGIFSIYFELIEQGVNNLW